MHQYSRHGTLINYCASKSNFFRKFVIQQEQCIIDAENSLEGTEKRSVLIIVCKNACLMYYLSDLAI